MNLTLLTHVHYTQTRHNISNKYRRKKLYVLFYLLSLSLSPTHLEKNALNDMWHDKISNAPHRMEEMKQRNFLGR